MSLTLADFDGNSTIFQCVIYSSAFASCSKLTNLTLRYSFVVTLSNINAFTKTPMSLSTLTGSFGSIYVPASLVSAYKVATNWATYADRITVIEGDTGGGESGDEGSEDTGDETILIDFTIDDTPYQAEKGMTWEQWVDSAYNTDGFIAGSAMGFPVTYNKSKEYVICDSVDFVFIASNTLIIADGIYALDVV
jgi:hypothetical protein